VIASLSEPNLARFETSNDRNRDDIGPFEWFIAVQLNNIQVVGLLQLYNLFTRFIL
jgi:hypothetical protein